MSRAFPPQRTNVTPSQRNKSSSLGVLSASPYTQGLIECRLAVFTYTPKAELSPSSDGVADASTFEAVLVEITGISVRYGVNVGSTVASSLPPQLFRTPSTRMSAMDTINRA